MRFHMEDTTLIIAVLGVVTAIVGLIKVLVSKKEGRHVNQTQKSGDNSINIQAGGNVNIGDAKWMNKNKK